MVKIEQRLTSGVNTSFPVVYLFLDFCPERIFVVMTVALSVRVTPSDIWVVFGASRTDGKGQSTTIIGASLWVFDFRIGEDADMDSSEVMSFKIRLTHLAASCVRYFFGRGGI